ncbi:hypothetical protein ABZV67_31495 [Streptomyces sp. NPDC005065]|uniref:hypothetical protein n=1 Tax=unclassified Streptomyces TaxID=2593676 RepID=UPI0033B3BF28
MTSQPPTGPPSGPLSPPPPPGPGPRPGPGPGPGPGDGSGRGPSGRRSRRNLVLIAVGAAVVVALGLVVLLRAIGGGNPAGGSSTPAGTGATTTPQAHRVVRTAALTPADWGPGFVKSTPYEQDPLAETVVQENCTLVAKPSRTGTLAAVGRRSRKAAPYENGLSQIRVYADTATAKKFLTDGKNAVGRCPNQQDGKARWKDIRETAPPDLPGFDDLVSEQGTLVTYNDGSAADIRYVLLTGRTGATVMTSYLSGPPEVEQQIHQGAEEALALMRSRLPQR